MNDYFNPYFPADFLTGYVTQSTKGLQRFQIYSIFRFLSSAEEANRISASQLQKQLGYTVTLESFDTILDYLAEDFLFSPSFRENSFDPVFLLNAIWIVQNSDNGSFCKLHEIISSVCPETLQINFTDVSAKISLPNNQKPYFYAALCLLACEYPLLLPQILPKFAGIYQEDMHFTCEDFVLYHFMDEYFEIKDCRANIKYQELIETLSLATLNAFDTTIEQCVTEDAFQQLNHPYSKFAGLYRYGALDIAAPSDFQKNCAMMKHLLEYAVTYELRNNLFDFHLDEDRNITLDNWKENLKWYNVQYCNVYELALSSFYAASLSQKLLKIQYEENVHKLYQK